MKAKELMTPNIEFIGSDVAIKDAAKKMKELDVGALPVNIGDETVGMITDRDIVIRAVAQGFDPEKHKVREAVSEGIISCNEDDEIETIADLMEDQQIRRILVKDAGGKITGIISLGDLAVKIQNEKTGEVLKKVSEPAQRVR